MHIQLVVTRGHASKLLAAAKEPLDGMALGGVGRITGAPVGALAPGRDDGTGAARGHERGRIVAAVGDEVGRGQALEQQQGLRGVVALASRRG